MSRLIVRRRKKKGLERIVAEVRTLREYLMYDVVGQLVDYAAKIRIPKTSTVIFAAGALGCGVAAGSGVLKFFDNYVSEFSLPNFSLEKIIKIVKNVGRVQEKTDNEEKNTIVAESSKENTVYDAKPPFKIWPVDTLEHHIISCFGFRGSHATGGIGSVYHGGLDIQAKRGTSVFNVGDGIISTIVPEWGRVEVDHGDGLFSEYLHMESITVTVGEKVKESTVLGFVGGRGPKGKNYYRPHLHFEIRDLNVPVEEGGAVLYENRVNAYCYFDGVELKIITAPRSGCTTQEGPNKFCDNYLVQEYSEEYKPQQQMTVNILNSIYEEYGTYINNAVEGTSIYTALVLALIFEESRGNPNAGIGNKHVGLLKFSAERAYDHDLCDNKHCIGRDERTDPNREITAAVNYLVDVDSYFSNYTNGDLFTIAAYKIAVDNGNYLVIKHAIENAEKDNGITDPSWDDVASYITGSHVCRYIKSLSKKKCEKKADEIRYYVARVQRDMELLE